jgi:hypothetical protein
MQADMTASLWPLLADQLADSDSSWALGTFGAIAEFSRDRGEAAALTIADELISVVTLRGGVRVTRNDAMQAFTYETPAGLGWNQNIAICLPQPRAVMNRREGLTEIGPDRDALDPRHQDALLFDLGLGVPHADICIRVADRAVAEALRPFCGRDVFAAGNPVMMTVLAANPHRVFVSPFARVEVYQPIPPHGGRSPEGPHTHVLPKLLAHRRTHAATDPIPDGLVPCLSLFPCHPAKDAVGRAKPFDGARHRAFQDMLRDYGEPDVIRVKERIAAAIEAGRAPSDIEDDLPRMNARIALRQLQAAGRVSPVLVRWLEKYERHGALTDGDISGCH